MGRIIILKLKNNSFFIAKDNPGKNNELKELRGLLINLIYRLREKRIGKCFFTFN